MRGPQNEMLADQAVAVFDRELDALTVARDLAATKEGTEAFFVMDVDRVRTRLCEWRALLPRVAPFYALKCNTDPVLVKILADCSHVGFDCADRQQLDLALRHVSPSRVQCSNSAWTKKSAMYASETGAAALVFEDASELATLVAVAENSPLILRVSMASLFPWLADSPGALAGCPLDGVEELLENVALLSANFAGFCFHLGARCTDPVAYYAAVAETRRLFDMAAAFRLRPKTLNVGGGFPGHGDQPGASFAEIAVCLNEGLARFFPEEEFPELRVAASPGRFFAAGAFHLCTNVIGKQRVDAVHLTQDDFHRDQLAFVYQQNEGLYGAFGCRLAEHCNPQCRPLFEADGEESEHYGTVLGPVLDGLDVAQPLVRFRQLRVGDWLLWPNMGAYSMAADEDTRPRVHYFAVRPTWNDEVPLAEFVDESRPPSSSDNFEAGSDGYGSAGEGSDGSDTDSQLDDNEFGAYLWRVFE